MNLFGNFDFFTALSSMMVAFQTFYFELTDKTQPVIPQPNCGKPCAKSSIYDCLTNSPVGRIMNGYDVVPNSYPWTVSIRLLNYGLIHYCGGALIYPQYVLTSAHCIYNESASQFVVAVGVHATNELNELNLYEVDEIQIHPLYIDEIVYNDIALLRLTRPVTFTENVSTICLPKSKYDGDKIVGKNVALSGWGSINGLIDSEPEVLQETLLTVLPNQVDCMHDYPLFKPSQMFCAKDPITGRASNSCSGDSGSPLVFLNTTANSTFVLHGLTSFVIFDQTNKLKSKCDSTKPSYYVKVSNYLNWITRSIVDMEKKARYLKKISTKA